MNRAMISFFLVWGVIFIVSCGEQQPAKETADLTGLAKEIVSSMETNSYEKVFSHFDAKMKEVMPIEKINQAWTALVSKVGAFTKVVGVRQTKEQGYDIVYVTCEFEKSAIDIKVVFNKDKQVSGLWFAPVQ